MGFASKYGKLGAVVVGLSLFLSASAFAAAAPEAKATEAVKKANDRLRELLGQPTTSPAAKDKVNQQITKELGSLLDIGLLAERALVDHWEKMTPKQRTDVVATLKQIIEKNYLSQLRGNLDYKIDYLGEEPKDANVKVKTAIRTEKNGRMTKILVDYTLRPEGAGWRVFDVITEDVSILNNYRSQFNRIIAKDGVDGLIATMRSKLEKGDKADKPADSADKAAKPADAADKAAGKPEKSDKPAKAEPAKPDAKVKAGK
ncbi:MAG TPA: ABC transporter substrate-binding protein [Myxococcales bacterium]|jgi:phospholipid transport system substrate-binding protein